MESFGVIGNISRDIAIYRDSRRYSFVGGAALNVAAGAALGGQSAAPVSVVGEDLAWIKNDPKFRYLDLSDVQVSPGASCSFQMAYSDDGYLEEIACEFGVSTLLTAHVLSVIGRKDHYHVCCRRPLEPGVILRRLAHTGLSFSADFHIASAHTLIPDTLPALTQAEFVFVNEPEFKILASAISLDQLATVIVSDGPRAVRVVQQGARIFEVAPEEVAPLEVSGAGDVLAGCFLAQWLEGAELTKSLRHAVKVASSSIQAPGATGSFWP